jgi:hypothetical protein
LSRSRPLKVRPLKPIECLLRRESAADKVLRPGRHSVRFLQQSGASVGHLVTGNLVGDELDGLAVGVSVGE